MPEPIYISMCNIKNYAEFHFRGQSRWGFLQEILQRVPNYLKPVVVSATLLNRYWPRIIIESYVDVNREAAINWAPTFLVSLAARLEP